MRTKKGDERVTQLYLRDLGYLLREMAVDAKERARAQQEEPDRLFESGRLMAFVELSLMQDQAEVFGLAVAAMSLGGIDPERDLLGQGTESTDQPTSHPIGE